VVELVKGLHTANYLLVVIFHELNKLFCLVRLWDDFRFTLLAVQRGLTLIPSYY
jgi:hypothetical protein